jgi:hypothetical protein
LQSAGTTAITVDTSQNVGIGTTTINNAVTTYRGAGVNNYIQFTNSTTGTASTDGCLIGVAADDTALRLRVLEAAPMIFTTSDTERMRIDSSGKVGIGTSSPSYKLDVSLASSTSDIVARFNSPSYDELDFYVGSSKAYIGTAGGTPLAFQTNNTERMRITSGGSLLVGKTTAGTANTGLEMEGGGGALLITRNGSVPFIINRGTDDGELIQFRQADNVEGTISVSGTTVSYNGGHLSRYAQTTTAKDNSLVKGTVLSNLDAMNVYIAPTTYWTEEDELPEGVNVGDVKVETHEVDNEQLNKVKVSDVEGDANVAGVFVNWSYDEAHQVDEINMAMTGDMIIRIAQGVTVQRGDLLMSAGDGTAKTQGDDIVRSKTIAKVTSNHVTCTYADGSYCVPCVLMAC